MQPYAVVMGRLTLILGAALAAILAVPIVALAGYGQPNPPPPGSGPPSNDRSVDANGNPFNGGLAFDPAHIKAKVGQTVSWTNTDTIVPHTATEDHFLWQLTGDYGPPGTMGFGPGETVRRSFAAGTWHYFCEIHPTQMRGVIDVPVTLKSARGERPGRFLVTATWSKEPLPPGQVFDVQERAGGSWKTVRDGVRSLEGAFPARDGQALSFRARVEKKNDPAARSGYSPVARITPG